MKAVVVFESMYGNTRAIAEAVGKGIDTASDAHVTVVPVSEADTGLISQADLLVVGGPTHAHGMSHAATRRAAQDAATKSDGKLRLDPAADIEGSGVRGWLDHLNGRGRLSATFDTRLDAPAIFTGRAAPKIARQLRRAGFESVTEPESFLVTKDTELCQGETTRALDWGVRLATLAASGRSAR